MSAAAKPLLDDGSLPLGTTHAWNNPNSGNSGMVTLISRFETDYQGNKLPCRKLKYQFHIRDVADRYNFEGNRCRVPDGSWKIL